MNSKIFAMILVLVPAGLRAQSVTFDEYIRAVARDNVSAIAEKYSLDIADANLKAARVFNDPELSVSYGNNQDKVLMMGQNLDFELGYDVNLAGARKARINVAKSEKEMTEASLNDYMCQLRADASLAWAEAWKLRQQCRLMEDQMEAMKKIAQSDSLRLKLGDISATDAAQSALEARAMVGEMMTLRSEYRNALRDLSLMAGGMPVGDLAEESLPFSEIMYSEPELYDIADMERSDLRAAELSHTLSENNLALVKASRALDLGLSFGYSLNTEVRNEIAPAPAFKGLTVGVTIPLKFSSLNRGEVVAAKAESAQMKTYYEAAKAQVMTEVAQAYSSYLAAREVKNAYSDEIVSSAASILAKRTSAYQKGDVSLIELLAARQTYNEIMEACIEAECNYYESIVMLNRAIGR